MRCDTTWPRCISKSSLTPAESTACGLIAVARASKEVPELKEKLETGELSLSNAKQLAPILNQSNKTEWLMKATELSKRNLEREIVKIFPKEATKERATYVAENRIKLELGLSDKQIIVVKKA